MTALVTDPEDWMAAFEERAAILEYDGHLPRAEAERIARIETVERLGHHPSTLH